MSETGNTEMTVAKFKSEVNALADDSENDEFFRSEVFMAEFGGFNDLNRPVFDADEVRDMATDAVIDAIVEYDVSTDVSDYFKPVVNRLIEQIEMASDEMENEAEWDTFKANHQPPY